MSTLWILVQWFLSVVVLRCIYLRYFHPLSRYPGPWFASFTNIWKFYQYLGGELHLVEQELHARYGSVVRTGPTSLSFSSLSAFEAIYGFNRSLEKGDFYSFSRDLYTEEENVFSARTDFTHREKRRKIVGPALSTSKVASYEPAISKNVSALVSQLEEALPPAENDSIIDVALNIHHYTLHTMHEIIYGKPKSSSEQGSREILSAFKGLSKWSWGVSLVPWFSWLTSTPPYVYLFNHPIYNPKSNFAILAALTTETQGIVFERPSRLEVVFQSQSSILKNFLRVPINDTKLMSLNDIWCECFNFTFAGPGSTAAALTAILYNLGTRHGHKWQDRIHAETSKKFDDTNISPSLVAVIKETIRLHAPFPSAFPRTVTPGAETVIPELPAPLPVGTLISSNTFVLGRSKEIWGHDAETWKPQRWLIDESKNKRELEDKFVVFGKGPRSCLGREIAMLMLTRAVVGVLKKWEIRAVGSPPKGKSYLEMQYTECKLSFTKRNVEE